MKLSDLEPHKVYSLVADDVDAIFEVIEPGVMPVCVIRGQVKNYLPTPRSVMTVQLIGWAPWGEDAHAVTGLPLFVIDEQPEFAWLVGICYRATNENVPELMLMACAPEIELKS